MVWSDSCYMYYCLASQWDCRIVQWAKRVKRKMEHFSFSPVESEDNLCCISVLDLFFSKSRIISALCTKCIYISREKFPSFGIIFPCVPSFHILNATSSGNWSGSQVQVSLLFTKMFHTPRLRETLFLILVCLFLQMHTAAMIFKISNCTKSEQVYSLVPSRFPLEKLFCMTLFFCTCTFPDRANFSAQNDRT